MYHQTILIQEGRVYFEQFCNRHWTLSKAKSTKSYSHKHIGISTFFTSKNQSCDQVGVLTVGQDIF